MGYTINLLQRVSDGALYMATGAFREVTSQADYASALFIGGDPENIPDNFTGLPNGEYRIMTFMTYGNPTENFPSYQGNVFANYSAGFSTNLINLSFPDGQGYVTGDFRTIAPEIEMGLRGYLIFTDAQVSTYNLRGTFPFEDTGLRMPEYYGTNAMDIFGWEGSGLLYTGGYSEGGGNITGASYIIF